MSKEVLQVNLAGPGATKKLLRLSILQQELLRAQEQTAEARLEVLQRGAAMREQEAEYAFHQDRRADAKESMNRDATYDRERHRPCMFIGTDIFFDEDEQKWACEHCGVLAHGDTPAMACENFDHIWVFGK